MAAILYRPQCVKECKKKQVYFIFKFSTTRVNGRFPHTKSLQWRHNDHDGVSNHQPRGCLLKRLYMRWSKKTSKLRVTGLCEGNSPGPVNSPHKGPVTRKMLPFDAVIIILALIISLCLTTYRCHPLRRACRHRGHCNNSYWGYHSPASSRDPQVGVVYVSTPRLQSRGRSRPAIRRLLLWCTSSWNRMMFHLQIIQRTNKPIRQKYCWTNIVLNIKPSVKVSLKARGIFTCKMERACQRLHRVHG